MEIGLHLIECENLSNEENLENYKCTKCKDSTIVVWGLQEKELCQLAKSAYEKIATFKANLYTVPANKIGKEFYDLYAETLEWANQETKRHYGWHINHILHPICLQNTDKKASQKQRTAKLKEKIERIKSGGLKVVINEAMQTQHNKSYRGKRRPKESGGSQTG